MLRLNVLRCPKCGHALREERAPYRCEVCGIMEACCEGICAHTVAEPPRDSSPTPVEALRDVV